LRLGKYLAESEVCVPPRNPERTQLRMYSRTVQQS
jgi:hypothetical protein